MIKLITVSDMSKIEHLPVEIRKQVKEHLEILDEAYGSNRTEFELGGFIAVVENEEDVMELKSNNILDVWLEEAEWKMDIPVSNDKEKWQQALFVISSDYSIVVVGRRSKMGFLRGE